MRGVRLKQLAPFAGLAAMRGNPFLHPALLLLAAAALATASPSMAQNNEPVQAQEPSQSSSQALPTAPLPASHSPLYKYNVALSGLVEISNDTNGNFIRVDTTEAGGGLLSLRRPYRGWLGYEVNLSTMKFEDSYNKNLLAQVEGRITELTMAYLLHSQTYYRMQGFITVGSGIVFASPVKEVIGNYSLSTEDLPTFEYSVGLDYPATGRFGFRVQYRGLHYKTPTFGEILLDNHTLRTSMLPSMGFFYRF